MDAQLDLLLSLTNMTFLREFMEEFDREWNITLKGEQIANGDLPGVINGVLDGLFATVKPIGKFCRTKLKTSVYLVIILSTAAK